ncbi:hypothetical protein [uncultured Shewanella sp.]|uniref:hypothetical protein n=1 Tax=uncultured Shewanella sp. TaxID=173975 RepID=UPI0026110BE1|nr:hypothetical protein [uncultured Shewanella sp.]
MLLNELLSDKGNMYEALILLSEAINPSLDKYAHEIEAFYQSSKAPSPQVSISQGSLKVVFDGIQFSIIQNCEASVAEESKTLAQLAESDQAQISEVSCRFELSSTPDYDMLYFNDYLFMLQAADKMGKVWAFKSADGAFI